MRPTPRPAGLAVAFVAAMLLAGCTRPVRDVTPMSPAERTAALESITRWEARGRIALKSPEVNGQGTFRWLQADDLTELRIAGPFGAGAYEIRWTPGRVTVLTGRGEVAAEHSGPDAAARFLQQEVGWSLPVGHTRYWLRGLAGPGTPGAATRNEAGLLVALVQDGWDINYADYVPVQGLALPGKLVLSGPAGRIRLVVDHWDF